MEELKEILGEELFNQVVSKLGDKKIMIDDKNFVPLSRLNEATNKVNEYKTQVETLNKELTKLNKLTKDNEEAQSKIAELQTSIEKKNAEMVLLNKKSLLKEALKSNGVKDTYTELLMNTFDLEKIEIENDKIKDVDNMMKERKENFKDLFGETKLAGQNPGKTNDKNEFVKNPWMKDSIDIDDQMKIYKNNPELAKQMMQIAGATL